MFWQSNRWCESDVRGKISNVSVSVTLARCVDVFGNILEGNTDLRYFELR